MAQNAPFEAAGGHKPTRRLRYLNAGFIWQKRIRRILELAGEPLVPGLPQAGDAMAVWGQSPYAARGEKAAADAGVPLVRLEDAFLRSLHPGRKGEPPLGLQIDLRGGVHFDAFAPSDLEHILATHPLDDTVLLNRARAGMARMKEADLSKYAGHDPDAPLPAPGYVLVIDQTRGDASVKASRADRNSFREMLYWAREENPGRPMVIKTHPETAEGLREGHFQNEDLGEGMTLLSDQVSPLALLEGAWSVYTVSSQMGFEAILAGHRPNVFGTPFYAGWGLTEDRSPHPLPRRGRALTKAQLFAGAMILAPTWYNPFEDRLGTFEDALEALAAQARSYREDRHGWQAAGIRLWKRKHMQRFFGSVTPLRFSEAPPEPSVKGMVWGAKPTTGGAARVEDGFLRSKGLGAKLVPPLSLVLDRSGIYFDPSEPSDLETLISKRAQMRPDQEARAQAVIRSLIRGGISKYNLGGTLPDLPEGRRILVPGQVEDDASILLGAGAIRTNRALLEAARSANPKAVILYKPHPDVVAGLRKGAVENAHELADLVVPDANIAALLDGVDEVWTMTSLTGFEALLRRKKVTVLGAPFYAGWGLTKDLGPKTERRMARPSLEGLVHAALIDYPRYLDPVTGLPCPVEVAIKRILAGQSHQGLHLRVLAKVQGFLASYAYLWR